MQQCETPFIIISPPTPFQQKLLFIGKNYSKWLPLSIGSQSIPHLQNDLVTISPPPPPPPHPKMNPNRNRGFLPLILTSLIVVGIPRCACQNEYENCGRAFECGGLKDIRYPFYGGNRPLSCGYRGFNLICQGQGAPLINISSIIYRVLEIDNQRQVLRVARNDLWGNVCTPLLVNTTLNVTLYNWYAPASDEEITLFYGCSAPLPLIIPLPYQFDCNANGIISPGFFVITVPNAVFTCSAGVSVRVNQAAAGMLANPATASISLLQTSLQSGFSIQWSADNERCSSCVGSNGTCGFNQATSSFVCYCSDGSYESTCQNSSPNQNGTFKSLISFLCFNSRIHLPNPHTCALHGYTLICQNPPVYVLETALFGTSRIELALT